MTERPWTSELHWVRASQQTRSGRTQAALLDAAEALFAERGVDATTVADIAADADSSVGAVYHHFRDKKAIMYALFDRYASEMEATTRAAVEPARWQDARIGDILHGYVSFVVRADAERPGHKRAALHATQHDPALAQHHRKLLDELDRGLRDLLLARRDEIGHRDPELAVAFVLEQLGAMLRVRLDDPALPTRMGPRTSEEFIAESVRSTCRYLEVDLPRPVARSGSARG